MKRYALLILIAFAYMSCQERTEHKDPAEVHPPSEAIPDSMDIENDSVITPDTDGEREVEKDKDHKGEH